MSGRGGVFDDKEEDYCGYRLELEMVVVGGERAVDGWIGLRKSE